MAITKQSREIVTVLPNGSFEVKTVTEVVEDGEVIASKNHRRGIDVGDDLTQESQFIKDLANGFHTPERIAARRAEIAAIQAQENLPTP